MATNILNNRTATELRDSIRRLINDTDTEQVVVPDAMLRELMIAQFILTQHEYGWNPQIPLRPTTGNAMLSYALGVGEYQTIQEGESDVVAVSEVWIDRAREPLTFVARETLEGWVANDLSVSGVVATGLPQFWSMRIDWAEATPGMPPPTQMKNRLLVYPACDQPTTVYWPRTVVDTEAVDPSSTGQMPFSYQATWGLEFKVAALLVKALDDDQLKKLRLDRGFFDVLWAEWERARDREQAERAMHARQDFIRESVA